MQLSIRHHSKVKLNQSEESGLTSIIPEIDKDLYSDDMKMSIQEYAMQKAQTYLN